MISEVTTGSVPAALSGATVEAALHAVAGQAVVAGILSAPAMVLTKGVFTTMLASKAKLTVFGLLVASVASTGVWISRSRAKAASPISERNIFARNSPPFLSVATPPPSSPPEPVVNRQSRPPLPTLRMPETPKLLAQLAEPVPNESKPTASPIASPPPAATEVPVAELPLAAEPVLAEPVSAVQPPPAGRDVDAVILSPDPEPEPAVQPPPAGAAGLENDVPVAETTPTPVETSLPASPEGEASDLAEIETKFQGLLGLVDAKVAKLKAEKESLSRRLTKVDLELRRLEKIRRDLNRNMTSAEGEDEPPTDLQPLPASASPPPTEVSRPTDPDPQPAPASPPTTEVSKPADPAQPPADLPPQ
jgi:hypothetical protein